MTGSPAVMKGFVPGVKRFCPCRASARRRRAAVRTPRLYDAQRGSVGNWAQSTNDWAQVVQLMAKLLLLTHRAAGRGCGTRRGLRVDLGFFRVEGQHERLLREGRGDSGPENLAAGLRFAG